LGISAAISVSDDITIGATSKFIYEKIFIEEASGYCFDFGGAYKASDNIFFGASILNVGSMNELNIEKSKLPTTVRFGASYSNSLVENLAVLGASDIVKTLDDNIFHIMRKNLFRQVLEPTMEL